MISRRANSFKFTSDTQISGFKVSYEDGSVVDILAHLEVDEQGTETYVAELVNPVGNIVEVTPYLITTFTPEVIIEEM